ncbi:MAG: hypothetical protein PF569_04620 [Candidatus Woesearchaeota archaeon]|jgi:hypothetical protein|nr:hypothetical protein [Candidatus Woesearchaeota archaeon]
MKFHLKKTLLSIFLIFGLIFVATSFISAGVLEHRILSPFGHQVADDATTYESGLRTESTSAIIDNSYSEIKEFNDNVDEPFCRIGGMYEIEVYNDASPGDSPSTNNYKMYYCKTTQDIIENIDIPASWGGDTNLLLYCNDGGNIKSHEYNFDFITSKANTYKTCILKNMDLNINNTIIYGYDVGNGVVDNYPDYYYNFEEKTGPILQDLIHYQDLELSSSTSDERIVGGLIEVPYAGTTHQECNYDERGEEVCYTVSDGYSRMSVSEALAWAQSNINPEISNLDYRADFPDEECNTFGGREAEESSWSGCRYTSDSYTEYFSMAEVIWPVGTFEFKGKFNESYFYHYNSSSKFYSLSSSTEELMIPLSSIFTNYASIDLSRVAIFKKINGKLIYGYEQNARQRFDGDENFEEDIKPVYEISIDDDFNFYTEEDCLEFLGVYDPSSLGTFDYNDKIICHNNMVEIISANINDDNNPDKAFHFFKNIVLNIK